MDSIAATLLEKVKAYRMPAAAVELLNKHRPLIISGATAAGKETIVRAIQQQNKGAKIVTHTTRPPREGEHNGVDYWFVSEARMIELIEEESFIEVKHIHGIQFSGSSLAAYQTVVDEGLRPLLVLDVHGVEEVRRHVSALEPMFILPPSFDAWMERLERRGHMSHVERVRRLESARVELDRALRDEHFTLIVNHDVKQASKAVLDGLSDPRTQMQSRELAQELIHHIDAFS